MLVLVGCEFSTVVREAFCSRGHDAYSCDLRSAPGTHFEMDLLDLLAENYPWDLAIFHPPCTHLAVSGAKHFAVKKADGRQQQGIDFFMACIGRAKRWAIENPVGIMSRLYRKPDQIIQPWQFGHPESKKTCLWLHNLPLLKPTNNVYDEMMRLPVAERNRIHHMPPSATREAERSVTYSGIAEAMALQWK